MNKLPAVYWDSMVFLYRLNQDAQRLPAINEVYEAAEAGKFLIVTSVITITEVLHSYGRAGAEAGCLC